MAKISIENYREQQWKIQQKSMQEMEKTVERVLSGKVSEDIIEDVAYGLVQQYGDAAASVACEFYDTLAENAGANVPDAEAAEPAGYDDVRNVVQSRPVTESPGAVGRFVKQAAEETMLQNCKRDHGEFAWVPSPGAKCAFCIMVASNGWRKIRSSDHAEHLHHNCKCEYVVRFDETTEVDGYEPEKLKEIYDNAEGTKWQEKLRSMQREKYEEYKDEINARRGEVFRIKRKKSLNEQLQFTYNGDTSFIPKHTIIQDFHVIAGRDSNTELRIAKTLADKYHNQPTDWNKMVGKIESDKYVFDIHWYEDEKGVMHEPKIKYMKERSK